MPRQGEGKSWSMLGRNFILQGRKLRLRGLKCHAQVEDETSPGIQANDSTFTVIL